MYTGVLFLRERWAIVEVLGRRRVYFKFLQSLPHWFPKRLKHFTLLLNGCNWPSPLFQPIGVISLRGIKWWSYCYFSLEVEHLFKWFLSIWSCCFFAACSYLLSIFLYWVFIFFISINPVYGIFCHTICFLHSHIYVYTQTHAYICI